jgi:farnesyl-diphosphate farnesyltransferase
VPPEAPPPPDLALLLEKTSRTFALSIPLLPEPTRNQVTVAYLLFRIADTFEDAAQWPRERRIRALHQFAEMLDGEADPAAPRSAAAVEERARAWAAALPSEHQGYLELLAATPFVLRRFLDLEPEARRIVGHHTVRTAHGMARFVARTDEAGDLTLAGEDDLVDYCYVVAGSVGEMLTDLFVLHREALAADALYLRARAPLFGEALQLVNILKDSDADAREGRRFLPAGLDRATVFRRARRDLEAASEYVLRLQQAQLRRGADRGLVAFTALPVRLAWATLDKVEAEGPGSKIGRPEVHRIAAELERALEDGTPAVPLPPQPASRAARILGSPA